MAADKNFTWSDEEINFLLHVHAVIDYTAGKAGEFDWKVVRSKNEDVTRTKMFFKKVH